MMHPKLLNPDWKKAGEAAGFTRVHITRVCRGQNHTTLDGAKRIAEVFGITLDELYAHITACRDARKTVETRVGKSAPPASTRKRGQKAAPPPKKAAPPPKKRKVAGKGKALSLTAA